MTCIARSLAGKDTITSRFALIGNESTKFRPDFFKIIVSNSSFLSPMPIT